MESIGDVMAALDRVNDRWRLVLGDVRSAETEVLDIWHRWAEVIGGASPGITSDTQKTVWAVTGHLSDAAQGIGHLVGLTEEYRARL